MRLRAGMRNQTRSDPAAGGGRAIRGASNEIREMQVVDLNLERLIRARQWRHFPTVHYTEKKKKPRELIQAVPAPDSELAEDAPANLVHRIRNGSRAAEAQLVANYRKPILELLRYRARDTDLAEDLLQETLLITIRRLRDEGIEEPEKLSSFIHRVAHNLVIAHFRKEARRNTRPDTEFTELLQDDSPSQQEALLEQENAEMVRQLLEELPQPRDREILLRFYVWNQEKQLVCANIGLTSDQFDRVISRARKRFKALVEEKMRDWS